MTNLNVKELSSKEQFLEPIMTYVDNIYIHMG